MTVSKAFGAERAKRAGYAEAYKGGAPGEIGDLRGDTERAMSRLEGRDSALEYPELDWLDGAVTAAGGDSVLKGRFLLQGQAFASVTVATSLELIAVKPGSAGNDFTVTVVDTGVGGLTITMVGNDLTIDQGGSASTEDTIATAINNATADTYQLIRANSGGGAAPTAAAQASFTGGAGEGWECLVSGVEASIKHDVGAATSGANLTEDAVTVTVPDLTAETDARAATDTAAITIKSDGVMTQSLAAVLA